MTKEQQVYHSLQAIEEAMRGLRLWQVSPPSASAFDSVEPFFLDTMSAEQWLQWVLLPRMYALLDKGTLASMSFAVAPYVEQIFEGEQYQKLITCLQHLDDLMNDKEAG